MSSSEVIDDLLMLQEPDHKALMHNTKASDSEWTPPLTKLVDRVITHYENQYRVESKLVIKDSIQVLLLSHVWPSYLEDAFLWVGGWRPSIFFHLLDFNPDLKLGVEVSDVLKGVGVCKFRDILPSQFVRLDELHGLTLQAETELTQSLSDTIYPVPFVAPNNSQYGSLLDIFWKANDLRLTTLKNLVSILSPIQAVQLFIPAAQLHLKVHTWHKNKQGAHAHAMITQHNPFVAGAGGCGSGPVIFQEVFEVWLCELRRDLEGLRLAAKAYTESTQSTDELTQSLCGPMDRVMRHYENYYRVKSESVNRDVYRMLAPAWMSLLEHALLWIGGWRPTTAFHLLYTVVGLRVESKLSELLEGSSVKFDGLGGLSSSQLTRVDELHIKTVRKERELTETFASFQETVADFLLVQLSSKATDELKRELERVGTELMGERVESTIGPKEDKLKEIFIKADDLRMETLKKVLEILTPIQAVDFLIAAADLHLRVHEWGNNKYADHYQHHSQQHTYLLDN